MLAADVEHAERARAACARRGIALVGVRCPAGTAGAEPWDDVVLQGAPLRPDVVAGEDDATILYTSGTTGT